jgi:hypothetical protein
MYICMTFITLPSDTGKLLHFIPVGFSEMTAFAECFGVLPQKRKTCH